MTDLVDQVAELRGRVAAWRAEGQRLALVPTMGALHEGHMALVAAARARADRTIVTIFVNPKQFAPNEDFTSYPRDLEADRARIDAAGADLVFAPALPSIYPDGFATIVDVGGPAIAGLEDRFRPTHFAGVATIVLKLLLQAQPNIAFFGEKDFQQLRMIEHMVRDLDVPVEIVGVPIVREADGLALSSRNAYLGADERARAPAMHAALAECAEAIGQGEAIDAALATAHQTIEQAGFVIDYVEARRADSLAILAAEDRREGRLLAAARIGRTRLIDNVKITRRGAPDRRG